MEFKVNPGKIDWSGKSVLVIGAARQGLALTNYLASHGAQVILNDRRPEDEINADKAILAPFSDHWKGSVKWVYGGHPSSILDDVDLVCVSGGVPLSLPLVQEALLRGVPLSNDSQIFLELAPCKVIGITGSAGKTTTTTLVGRIAASSQTYRKIWVGGNIGAPLITDVDSMRPDDLVVMELSSFQLEIMTRSPQVAAILNITPNHLDRHGTMEVYRQAKARILDHQTAQDIAILGRDDPVAISLKERVRGDLFTFGLSDLKTNEVGVYLQQDQIYLHSLERQDVQVLKKSEIHLRGKHNLLNVMAASMISIASGLPIEAIPAGVRNFYGVPHRLEFVRTWGGAEWYNDSIATAPERSMAAIESFQEPLVLLAGGRDKNLPWENLAHLVCQRVDHIILFGEAGDKIRFAIDQAIQARDQEIESLRTMGIMDDQVLHHQVKRPFTITQCSNLSQAVQAATNLVEFGDVVLLSPGGTSFDEFHDFEERGRYFTQLVKELP